jgi:hypothetical protein
MCNDEVQTPLHVPDLRPYAEQKDSFYAQFFEKYGENDHARTEKGYIWCHGQSQECLDLPDCVKMEEGLGVIDTIDGSEPPLLILDNLMQEAGEDKTVSDLFTKGSHHKDLSVVMLVQNTFHQGKFMRTISLNAHYMVLFKNPRDAGQIRHLSAQLFREMCNFWPVHISRQHLDRLVICFSTLDKIQTII